MASRVAIPKGLPLAMMMTLLTVAIRARAAGSAPERASPAPSSKSAIPAAESAPPAPSPIFISYRAPSTCPGRVAFIQRLLTRTAPAALTDDSKRGRSVSVTLEVEGEQFLGRMEFEDEGGHYVTRTVRANQCEEVVSAMAFVTALAIDALISGSSNRTQRAQQSDSNDGEGADTTSPSSSVNRPLPNTTATTIATPKRPSVAVPSRYVHELAIGIGIVNRLVGPNIAMGARVEWGFGPRPLLPAIRVGATWSDSRTTVDADGLRGVAHFQLLAGDAQLCLGRALTAQTLLTGALCSGLEFGRFMADGTPESPSSGRGNSYPMLWSSVMTSVHLRVEDERMFFDFSPLIRLPLVRRDFVTAYPEQSPNYVFSFPAASFGATWSMGMSFR